MELDCDHKVLVFVFYSMPQLSLGTSDVCSDLLDCDRKVLVFVFYSMPRLSLGTSDVCSDLNMRAAEWLLASRRHYMLTSST